MVELGVVSGGVERGREGANIVVVFSAEVDGGDVHSAVVSPIVCEWDDKLDAELLGDLYDLIECTETGSAVVYEGDS